MLLSINEFEYFFAQIRLNELEEYLNTTEKYLQRATNDLETSLDERVKGLSPQEREEFYDSYGVDAYWRYSERFPRILRNSFLVSAQSLLEYELNVFCEKIKKEQQIPVGWRDLNGDTLERAKLYFQLAKFRVSYDDRTWQEINRYSKIRNCIVHKNGLIEGFQGKKDLINYINKTGIISQDTIRQEIALTGEFCKEVIQTLRDFLDNIYKAYVSQKQSKTK